eukprot:146789-Hanusia_phi.AAC.1
MIQLESSAATRHFEPRSDLSASFCPRPVSAQPVTRFARACPITVVRSENSTVVQAQLVQWQNFNFIIKSGAGNSGTIGGVLLE